MLTANSLREKEAVRAVVADLVITCLWNPEIGEVHGETAEHDIRVWKDKGIVSAEVKHK